MEREELAKLLLKKKQDGTVTTVFYPVKVKSGGNEHQVQAIQFALDHESVGMKDGELSIGVASPINAVPVWDMLAEISQKGTELLAEFSLLAEGELFKTNDVAFLTHGTDSLLEIGVVVGDSNGWIGSHYADFAKKISVHLSQTTRILIYGCSVAGAPGTPDPFAEKFRRSIFESLESLYGSGNVTTEVWGHKDVGHTTANDRLVQFNGTGNYNGGDSLLDDFAWWVCYDKITAKGLDPLTYTDAAKLKQLTDASYSAMLRALQAAGPTGQPKDDQGNAYTSPDHPINTLIREIPYIGIANFWNDIHATTQPDYSRLSVTDDTKARLVKAVLIKRRSFDKKYAELDSVFDKILS